MGIKSDDAPGSVGPNEYYSFEFFIRIRRVFGQNDTFLIHSIENFGKKIIFNSFDQKITEKNSFLIHPVIRKIIRLKIIFHSNE